MFTDMVGYTALGQRNESLALDLVQEQGKIVRQILIRHNGREVKAIGDAFLVEFSSALDAVRCAYDIQRAIREFNFSLSVENRAHLRVGLHLGDVVPNPDGSDISGDAVNVASRIEPLAEIGGVCLTRQVYESVKGKLELEMQSLGFKSLKNVSEPIEVFKVLMPWSPEESVVEKAPSRNRIAVLPFRNMSSESSDEYFAEGMTEELITTLAKIRHLTVIARTSVMQYKNSTKRVTEISKELGVGTLIEGSVRKSGEKLRITVQLIDSKTEGHLWAQNYDNKFVGDVFGIQSEIAEKVANELQVQLVDQERTRLESTPTLDTGAYMLYLKGRHFWNERSKDGIDRALLYYQEAIKKDPRFALGYSGIADCYQVMARNGLAEFGPGYEKGKEYAIKALELDKDLAEAHATLGGTLHYYEHDWRGAELEYKKAIDLKPSYATAHQWYSHVLAQERRFEEARKEIIKAHELDPFSTSINHNLGAFYYFIQEYRKSIEQFNKIKELDPKSLAPYIGPGPSLIRAYVQTREYESALLETENLAKILGSPKHVKLWKAYVRSAMGDKAGANELMRDVEEDYSSENVSPYDIAIVHFMLGEVDFGFRWLETAYVTHDGSLNMLAVDIELVPLRNDPRYLAMLKKIGLDHVSFAS